MTLHNIILLQLDPTYKTFVWLKMFDIILILSYIECANQEALYYLCDSNCNTHLI